MIYSLARKTKHGFEPFDFRGTTYPTAELATAELNTWAVEAMHDPEEYVEWLDEVCTVQFERFFADAVALTTLREAVDALAQLPELPQ